MPAGLVSDSDFEQKVLKTEKPVLVDFFADWCGPCKLAAPVLDELASQYVDKVTILKLDVDKNPSVAERHGVMSIPTTVLFKDGKEVGRQIGFAGKQKFIELLEKAG